MAELPTPSISDPDSITIRLVTETDLVRLEWEGEYKRYRRMYAGLFRGMLTGMTLMWLIEDAWGTVIGQAFVMLKSSEREAADGSSRAYLFAFRVRPAWRNRGIGTRMMAHIEQDLLRRGYSYVTLNVAKENPDARRLYERLGYKVTASKPGVWSYRDDEGNMQHMVEPAWRMMKRIKGRE
ncbi:MAG: GNAT family N-acetyltransferase [Anaerolineaceae bacterium]|nr:GNAT family N-acetyltransferase [Anaerolineaceae bacterium]